MRFPRRRAGNAAYSYCAKPALDRTAGIVAGTLGRGPMGWDQRKRRTAARAAKPAARAIAFGDPFGHTLERGNKTEKRHDRPEQPRREVESAQRENDRAAARELEDRAGPAPLGRSEARDPGHVARSFGEL